MNRLSALDPALACRALTPLRSALERAGYTAESVAERLRLDRELRFRSAEIPVHGRRLTSGDALDSLIALFLFQRSLDRERVGTVLAPARLDDLASIGLLAVDADTVRATVRVTPAAGKWYIHDPNDASGLRPDSVLGWTPAARTLASLTVRRPVARALDLGTGSGLQALMAAEHATQVVATDINARALWITQLTCELNGVANIECRQGDMFEPVKNERFDLIVSNPPFVISPATDYLFRDGGRTADSMSRDVVAGAAAALEEGGFATVMCNWVMSDAEAWWARPEAWVEGCDCDALLLYYEALDPLKYASVWIQNESLAPEQLEPTLDQWLEYYQETGVDAVGVGAVVLRKRRAAGNWLRRAEIARGPSGSASAQLLRIFAIDDEDPRMATDEGFLDRTMALVEGHRLEQVLRYRDGGYRAEAAELVLDQGIGLRGRISAEALHVLLRLDGRRPLKELVADAAEETDLDHAALTAATVASLRELLRLGFVVAVA